VELHLFSSPGVAGIEYVVDAFRPYLRREGASVLAYIPAASANAAAYYGYTQKAFSGVGEVRLIDVTTSTPSDFAESLRGADAVCLPGGNAYLMAHRLHRQGYWEHLRDRVVTGLPVIAFSAGTVLCGASMLTSNDIDEWGLADSAGLRLVPWSFNVHYPAEASARAKRDSFLNAQVAAGRESVCALEDGAHLEAGDTRLTLVRGRCWLFCRGQKPRPFEGGVDLNSV